MQEVTQALVEIMSWHGHFSLSYIDDIAGAHTSKSATLAAHNNCADVMRELGLVEAKAKELAVLKLMREVEN